MKKTENSVQEASQDELVIANVSKALDSPKPRRFRRVPSVAKNEDMANEAAAPEIMGFGPMSRITTSFGEVYAQTLREGDMVRCKEGGFRKIVAINRITLGGGYLKYHPAAQPVVIRAGGFGSGLPTADLTLAPSQTLHASQRFAVGEMRKAADAMEKPHVYRRPENIITYTQFHCGEPATVLCEGVWVDTAP